MNGILREALNALPIEKRAKFYATGRPTVQRIQQLGDKFLITRYVGKLRGVVVENSSGEYKFESPEQAMEAAKWFRDHMKKLSEGKVANA